MNQGSLQTAGSGNAKGARAARPGGGIKNFFRLYLKECRKVLFSLTFLLYAAAVLAMYYTQFHSELNAPEEQPKPGLASYGTTAREVPEILMPNAIERLIWEYRSNRYVAYPVGFYKEVHLTEKKRQKMADIITELTGLTREELEDWGGEDENDFGDGNGISLEIHGADGLVEAGDDSFVVDGGGNPVYEEPSLPEYQLPADMTYGRFRELMREADDLIGGGSNYGDSYIVQNFSRVPKTYEEALEEYRQLMEDDKITGAYARLYCDYVGMILGILPIFVAVSLMQLDRKARMEQLVFSRRVSSAKLIFARYAALVTVMLLPVAVTAAIAQIKVMGFYPGAEVDLLAFARNTALWLLPSLMAVTAVGMFLTELASGLVAILLQGAWWFVSIFSGALSGGIGKFNLTIRHNSLYYSDVFRQQYGDFLFNRAFFAVAAILLVALAAVVYEEKRRGRNIGIYALVKNRKSQSAA